MSPDFVFSNQPNKRPSDAILSGYFNSKSVLSCRLIPAFAYLDNVNLRQLGFGVIFSYSWRSATFHQHVMHIVFVRSQKEMVRTNARWIIAAMANKHFLLGWAVMQLKRITTRSPVSAKNAVSAFLLRAYPFPTDRIHMWHCWAALIDHCPKYIFSAYDFLLRYISKLNWVISTIFRIRVLDVIPFSSEKQVVRTNTGANITPMTDDHIFRDRAICQLKRIAMCSFRFSIYGHSAVSLFITPPSPDPTRCTNIRHNWPIFIYPFPKSILSRFVKAKSSHLLFSKIKPLAGLAALLSRQHTNKPLRGSVNNSYKIKNPPIGLLLPRPFNYTIFRIGIQS